MVLSLKCCMPLVSQPSGANAAKMPPTLLTTEREIHSRYDWIGCARIDSPTLSKRLVNWVPMVAEIISENVKLCVCSTMIELAKLLKYLVCAMVELDFCRIAARADLVTLWQVVSSAPCSR